jgi:hypothetical protein
MDLVFKSCITWLTSHQNGAMHGQYFYNLLITSPLSLSLSLYIYIYIQCQWGKSNSCLSPLYWVNQFLHNVLQYRACQWLISMRIILKTFIWSQESTMCAMCLEHCCMILLNATSLQGSVIRHQTNHLHISIHSTKCTSIKEVKKNT